MVSNDARTAFVEMSFITSALTHGDVNPALQYAYVLMPCETGCAAQKIVDGGWMGDEWLWRDEMR